MGLARTARGVPHAGHVHLPGEHTLVHAVAARAVGEPAVIEVGAANEREVDAAHGEEVLQPAEELVERLAALVGGGELVSSLF